MRPHHVAEAISHRVLATGFDVTATDPPAGVLALAVALVFGAIHVFAGNVRALSAVPRSRLLSMSGGVTVAYVFVHVLPELERASRPLESGLATLPAREETIYLLTLLGFVSYYGLEQLARRSAAPDDGEGSPSGLFWVHIGSFAVYNGLIGYLLFHPETPGAGNLSLFSVAMASHFLVNDVGLREHYHELYDRIGRWLLAGAVLAGAVVGALTGIDRGLSGAVFALLSGAIVLNVIKEELPTDRESRFSAFALGAGAYALLLLSH